MQINSIEIKHFRKFTDLHLPLKPGANLLMGVNGSGKTSILEALKVILGGYLFGINSSSAKAPSIHKSKDVQLKQMPYGQLKRIFPTTVKAKGVLFDRDISWSRSLRTAKGQTTTRELNELKQLVSSKTNSTLPLIGYYSTARLQTQRKETSPFKQGERYEAYYNTLEASSSISRFIQWYENQDRISYQQKQDTFALKMVNQAIQNCLPSCKRIFYDANLTEIVIEDTDRHLTPFSLMSDGYQLITAMVGDMAYRCAILNVHLEETCLIKTPGVILIDEIEMHLHPSWQQRVVNDLVRTFPQMQFIITTHSPIVLSGNQANVIRLNKQDEFDEEVHAFGRKQESVLVFEQGAQYRNQDVQEQIDEFYELIENKEGLKAAKKILDELFIKQLGEDDPETKKAIRDYDFALEELEDE